MTNGKSKNGFTLLELLIAMALIGLIGVLLAAIYFANFRLFSNQDVAIEVSNQSRIALDEMTNQIRQSVGVFGGCGVGGDPADTLKLKLWRIDAAGDPIEGLPEDQIRYKYKSATKTINKTVEALGGSERKELTDKIIATKVKSLNFVCDAPVAADVKQVTITLTTEAKTFNKTHTVTQEAKAQLRNK